MKTWIDEAEHRADEATHGPWEQWIGHSQVFTGPSRVNTRREYKPAGIQIADTGDNTAEIEPPEVANAVFIAAARTDVPRLCKALKMLLDDACCDCGYWPDHDCTKGCMSRLADRIRKGDF